MAPHFLLHDMGMEDTRGVTGTGLITDKVFHMGLRSTITSGLITPSGSGDAIKAAHVMPTGSMRITLPPYPALRVLASAVAMVKGSPWTRMGRDVKSMSRRITSVL